MKLPAGRYYVGDLCYVMHERWDEVCDKIINDHRILEGQFALEDGTVFALFSTAYGDGTYQDTMGRRYPVDAGSIGCVLVDQLNLTPESGNDLEGGNVIIFDRPFLPYSDGRYICFGETVVDTDPDPVEYYHEEEDEYNVS